MLSLPSITQSYLATDTTGKQTVVWNEFQLDRVDEKEVSQYMEYCIQCSRDFPQFFVCIQAYWIDRDRSLLITIMEYLQKGCMEDYLLKGEYSSMLQRSHTEYPYLVRSWVISILHVLDSVHSLPSPLFLPFLSISSFFFVENYENIKLTLFPLFLSKAWRESLDHVRYLPLEVIDASCISNPNIISTTNIISDASEMYSLGVCIWEMMTGKVAFDASTLQDMIAQKQSTVTPRKTIER